MIKDSQALHWKPHYTLQESAVSTTLHAWLVHAGSFMQRLAARGAVDARVHVLSQTWQCAEPWENALLDIVSPEKAFVREVLIASADKYWMFARSVFPRQLLTGKEAEFAHLGTRPLGTLLFDYPGVKRDAFFYTCLQPGMLWHQKIINQLRDFSYSRLTDTFQPLWSRCSVFHLQEKSLLLTEVFLPDVAVL